jgi:phospholipid transport system transporter-binding protein
MKSPANNSSTATLTHQGEGRFTLTGDLNFQTVPLVWQQGKDLLNDCQSVEVDLSGVAHCNSAGLALLIEWLRIARANNQSIVFRHLPTQMQNIARVCGVDNKLPT